MIVGTKLILGADETVGSLVSSYVGKGVRRRSQNGERVGRRVGYIIIIEQREGFIYVRGYLFLIHNKQTKPNLTLLVGRRVGRRVGYNKYKVNRREYKHMLGGMMYNYSIENRFNIYLPS